MRLSCAHCPLQVEASQHPSSEGLPFKREVAGNEEGEDDQEEEESSDSRPVIVSNCSLPLPPGLLLEELHFLTFLFYFADLRASHLPWCGWGYRLSPGVEAAEFMVAVQRGGGVDGDEEGVSQGAGDMQERVVGSGIVVPRTVMSTPTTWSRLSWTAHGPPAHPPISKVPQDLVHAPTPPETPFGPTPKRSLGGQVPTSAPAKRPKLAARSLSRSTGPALGPSHPVPPFAPIPPLFYHRAGGVQVSADLAPKTKLLSQIGDKSGAHYLQRAKPYIPWTTTDADLWAAHHLLNGTGEWAVSGPSFLPSGIARRSDGKGAKYGCDFCSKVYTNFMDGRGHTQAHYMGGKLSSPSAPATKALIVSVCLQTIWTSSTTPIPVPSWTTPLSLPSLPWPGVRASGPTPLPPTAPQVISV